MIRKSLLFFVVLTLFSAQAFAYRSSKNSLEATPDLPAELLLDLGYSESKSICDGNDDRTPSFKMPMGRILQTGSRAGCTVTMIGRTCALSAGHCTGTFQEVHFNTPLSRNGRIQLPRQEDIYYVDSDSVVSRNTGVGGDWAVLRIEQNEVTGHWPGDAQGFLEMSYHEPQEGDIIRITGYGTADGDDVNFAQQTHTGPISEINTGRNVIRHRADTTGGNSGSAVVDEATGKIIGVHTHGGCWRRGGANSSTLYHSLTELQEAVHSCLQWEEENL